ncbi:MAG: hypothetical protein ACQETE_05460 [Bacteroidota bacterium]
MKRLLSTFLLIISFPIVALAQWQVYGGLSLDHSREAIVTTSTNSLGLELGAQWEAVQIGIHDEISIIVNLQGGLWSDKITNNENISCDDCLVFNEEKVTFQGLVGIDNPIWDKWSVQLLIGPSWNWLNYVYESGGDPRAYITGFQERVIAGNTQFGITYHVPSERFNFYSNYRLAFPIISENDIPYWQQFSMGVRYKL